MEIGIPGFSLENPSIQVKVPAKFGEGPFPEIDMLNIKLFYENECWPTKLNTKINSSGSHFELCDEQKV